jgi:4-hydroxysphinganine ceramide fatty acyl 2-hydroxylase
MNKTIAHTHPAWLKVLVAKNPLVVLITMTPLFVLFYYTAYFSSLTTSLLVSSYLLGILYWTFVEYAIHRWAYHVNWRNEKVRWVLETFHLHHHRDLTDHRVLNAGILLEYPMAFLLLLPIYLAFGFEVMSAVGAGLLTMYFFYECVHYAIHYKKHDAGYMKFIQKYHMYHHEFAWKKNFGNTSVIWDRLFGTYDPKYKDYSLSEERILEMITSSN